MRVVFMGTPAYALPSLLALIESRHELLAVVAQPDRRGGRGRKLLSPPTVTLARQHGIPVFQPRAVKRGPFPEAFCALGADVAVVVAYGRILTPRLLGGPRLGCVNAHASLLPKYRGAGPIQWAVARGERQTGVTTMLMDEGLDTGPMLMKRAIPIGPDENAGDLALRLADLSAELLLETLDVLTEIEPQPQDHAACTLAPPLRKSDGHIDWVQPAQRIHELVRGMIPWPCASAVFRGERMRVVQTRPLEWDVAACEPGVVVQARKRLVVAAADGALQILQAQPASRRCQPGHALINGLRIQVGEVFQ